MPRTWMFLSQQAEALALDYQTDVLNPQPLPPPKTRERIKLLLIFEQLVFGGAELLHLRLAQGLPRERYDVRIGLLLPGGGIYDRAVATELPIVSFCRRYPADVSPIWRIRRYCRTEEIDLTLGILWLSSAFAGLAGIGTRTRVIGSTRQDNYHVQNCGRLRAIFDRALALFLATRIVNSPRLREYLARHRYPSRRITVIPNGITVPDMADYAERRKACRAQYGIPPQAPCVGIMAVLRPEKDHTTFLRAIARLLPRFPEARFVIAGDGAERARIEWMVDDLGLRAHVIFTGMVPNAAAIMPALDVLALTSQHEGVPNVILEAMAWARPVVATHVAGVADVVGDGTTGIITAVGDDRAIAAGIARLIETPELADADGPGRGGVIIQTAWSNQRMVDDYDALFQRCLS